MFIQAKKDAPKTTEEYIRKKILDRRYLIQSRLDDANMKQGCDTEETMKAKTHYEEFSRYNKDAIKKFIDEKSGGG